MSKAQNKSTSKQAAPVQAPKSDAYDFKTAAQRFTTAEVVAYADKLKASFDTRIGHEMTKATSGSADLPIVQKLNKRLAQMLIPDVTRGMMELEVKPDFINDTTSKDGNGARFNIYAIDKAIKLVKYMMATDKVPDVLLACLKSMVNFKTAGETFTRAFAEAAVCNKIRLEQTAASKLLVRHTVDKATASTQTSSNMRVLAALGLITVKGGARSASYEFADTNQAKHLQQLVAA